MQESIQERFLNKVRARMQNLRLGSPLDKSMDVGALVDPVQRQRIAVRAGEVRQRGIARHQGMRAITSATAAVSFLA